MTDAVQKREGGIWLNTRNALINGRANFLFLILAHRSDMWKSVANKTVLRAGVLRRRSEPAGA